MIEATSLAVAPLFLVHARGVVVIQRLRTLIGVAESVVTYTKASLVVGRVLLIWIIIVRVVFREGVVVILALTIRLARVVGHERRCQEGEEHGWWVAVRLDGHHCPLIDSRISSRLGMLQHVQLKLNFRSNHRQTRDIRQFWQKGTCFRLQTIQNHRSPPND